MRMSPCRRPAHAAGTEPSAFRPGSPFVPAHLSAISKDAAIAAEHLGRPVSPESTKQQLSRTASIAAEHLGRPVSPESTRQQLSRTSSAPMTKTSSEMLVGPGLPVSADKLASMQSANEELRARNVALLQRSISQEEELWRVKSASRALHPSEHVAAYPRRNDEPATAVAMVSGDKEVVSGTLWQFLDIAVSNCTRARADVRRGHAESLIQLDKSFTPQEKDARLRARGIISQITRASAKMMAATQQLESEAAAAKMAHESDVAAWATRLRVFGTRMQAQQEATAAALLIELDRAEREHTEHAKSLSGSTDELELRRQREASALHEEVHRLQSKLAQMQKEAADGSAGSAHREQILQADNTALRSRVARLEAELAEEQSQRAEEQHTHEVLVAELQAANSQLRSSMGEDAVQSQMLIGQLRGQLRQLQSHYETTTSELHREIGLLTQMKDEQAAELRDSLERLRIEKLNQRSQLTEQIRAVQADREADANHLHAKIERLRALHTAALAAGSVRGRQLLYQESMKSPGLLRQSSASWRGEDVQWRPPPAGSPRSTAAPEHRSPPTMGTSSLPQHLPRGVSPRSRRPSSPGRGFESP